MQLETHSSDYEQAWYDATCQIAKAVNASGAQMYEWNLATAIAGVVAEYHSPRAEEAIRPARSGSFNLRCAANVSAVLSRYIWQF